MLAPDLITKNQGGRRHVDGKPAMYCRPKKKFISRGKELLIRFRVSLRSTVNALVTRFYFLFFQPGFFGMGTIA